MFDDARMLESIERALDSDPDLSGLRARPPTSASATAACGWSAPPRRSVAPIGLRARLEAALAAAPAARSSWT